ncbi:MAG: hypothetical protein F9K42_12880 [Ignavibacterium sp.]|nr:MAG: hypothetical protein F9K42_12880 [Ignavibacterium sp.]
MGYLNLTNPETMFPDNYDNSVGKTEMLVKLKRNFSFLKQTEIFNQNIFNTKSSRIPSDKVKLKKLSYSLGFRTTENFTDMLNEVVHSNKNYFQLLLKK